MPKGYHHVTQEQRSQISALKAIATSHNKIAQINVHRANKFICILLNADSLLTCDQMKLCNTVEKSKSTLLRR